MKYFNNAGASIVEDNVIDVQIKYLQLEKKLGGYSAAIHEKEKIESFYALSAKLLNCDKDEILFVQSASVGWNIAIHGLPFSQNDTIITLDTEFGTNLIAIKQFSEKSKCNVEIIKTASDGSFKLSKMEQILKQCKGKKCIAISHAVAQGSIVYPVKEIGALAKKYNAIYIVDGCQSIGQMNVDVKEIGCDALMTSGRKWLRGPRGTGIMYVSKTSPLKPLFLDLSTSDLQFDKNNAINGLLTRTDAKRFELWEKPISAQLGLSVAIENYLKKDTNLLNQQSLDKALKIREAVFNNPKYHPIGTLNAKTSITGFYFNNNETLEKFKECMADNDFELSYMSDWDFPLTFPKGVKKIVRIAPSYFTSDANVDELLKLLKNF